MVSQQEPVVTGDAVVLDIQIAQLPVRALSAIIDVTVVFILYISAHGKLGADGQAYIVPSDATEGDPDTWIDQRAEGQRPTLGGVVGLIDWPEFLRFVVGKTIPFFWIPVQTLNFMLPPHYRIIVAAYLSIALGLILAYARRRKKTD
jgi:hypothetical protein